MRPEIKGLWLGLIGVIIFALTLPFTRIAVREFDPFFVAIARTVLAAGIAGPLLILLRQPRPSWSDVRRILFVIAGVILGFPIFSALALKSVPASHGGVVLGALPLATAVMGTFFAAERPSESFWFWSLLGSALVIAYALWDGGGHFQSGDFYLAFAVIAASMGYAACGQLSRKLGGWQVICWALVVALPVTLPLTIYLSFQLTGHESLSAWGSFAYAALMSQLVGFFFWNQGLSLGGIAKVGQVQLLQTFFTLAASAMMLGEIVTSRAIIFALATAACVWFARKAAVKTQGQ